ncbi:hypothetical protein BP00DRAFT_249568 [Aspergillus indologenus CBS 114.80]|uniref:Uncharacterized protein n=1 Tax=Aspergillus indologenus CBS 114.80 TaxID=1450541 RepID=A0A2V5IXH0_9EURO|nr:hypothetical protein BP00DRAFT_249568 [Aspergillus indologenus CBS 114.80]
MGMTIHYGSRGWMIPVLISSHHGGGGGWMVGGSGLLGRSACFVYFVYFVCKGGCKSGIETVPELHQYPQALIWPAQRVIVGPRVTSM